MTSPWVIVYTLILLYMICQPAQSLNMIVSTSLSNIRERENEERDGILHAGIWNARMTMIVPPISLSCTDPNFLQPFITIHNIINIRHQTWQRRRYEECRIGRIYICGQLLVYFDRTIQLQYDSFDNYILPFCEIWHLTKY